MFTKIPFTWVDEDHLERRGHLLLRGAAAHVEEVRRLAAEVLDDVHRRHRQAGAVHQQPMLPVERHVRQVRFFASSSTGSSSSRSRSSTTSFWR
jgi:hypothetical protein